MSLTPRDDYDATTGKIVRKPQTGWAAVVAAEEGVPFVDLNEISGRKLDSYSHWKEKYHFYGDHIHTSYWGAQMNARSAAEGLMASRNPDLEPLKAMMTGVELPVWPVERKKGKPVVWITGDSTVKNKDSEKYRSDADAPWTTAATSAHPRNLNMLLTLYLSRCGGVPLHRASCQTPQTMREHYHPIDKVSHSPFRVRE